MPKWTNIHNLPDRVIRVIQGHYKDKRPELGRLSITDLIDEPLPRLLFITRWDDIVRDYSDLLTATQGTALHERYEMCATEDDDTEHKYEDAVSDVIVVGKADNYVDKTVFDIKQTGVYGPQYKKDKWEAQLNCYAWQRRKRNQEVEKLLVDVWYRDWKENNIHWRDYPQIPFEVLELPLWSFEQQDGYIRDRVQIHQTGSLKCCSNKQRGIRFEAYKQGNKTPTKVEDTRGELETWADNQKFKVEIVQSEPIFCQRYCKSRSVCPFVKEK